MNFTQFYSGQKQFNKQEEENNTKTPVTIQIIQITKHFDTLSTWVQQQKQHLNQVPYNLFHFSTIQEKFLLSSGEKKTREKTSEKEMKRNILSGPRQQLTQNSLEVQFSSFSRNPSPPFPISCRDGCSRAAFLCGISPSSDGRIFSCFLLES